MRVSLDRNPITTDARTIGEALRAAADQVEPAGRLIVDVIVDGHRWTDTELTSATMLAGEASELDLVSADLRSLVIETLGDVAGALTEADAAQRSAAELVQSDRIVEAMEPLGRAIGIWTQARDVLVQSASLTGLDLAAITCGDATVGAAAEELGAHLRTIRTALEEDDPATLSDTLLYDMPAVVVQWREIIDLIAERIRGETGA